MCILVKKRERERERELFAHRIKKEGLSWEATARGFGLKSHRRHDDGKWLQMEVVMSSERGLGEREREREREMLWVDQKKN